MPDEERGSPSPMPVPATHPATAPVNSTSPGPRVSILNTVPCATSSPRPVAARLPVGRDSC